MRCCIDNIQPLFTVPSSGQGMHDRKESKEMEDHRIMKSYALGINYYRWQVAKCKIRIPGSLLCTKID